MSELLSDDTGAGLSPHDVRVLLVGEDNEPGLATVYSRVDSDGHFQVIQRDAAIVENG